MQRVLAIINTGNSISAYVQNTDGTVNERRLLPPLFPTPTLKISTPENICCYLLRSLTTKRTYVGVTVNRCHRLTQHNGELSGGAKYTQKGRPWKMVSYITGFPTYSNALQLEWKLHHYKSRRSSLSGRIQTMSEILSLEKWTSNSPHISTLNLTINWLELHRLSRCPPHCREVWHC